MKKITLLLFIFYSGFIFSQTQIGNDIDGLATEDQLGWSTSISDDGSIVAAGASGIANKTGYVQVFINNNGTWMQRGNTINGDTAGDFFGHAISLSSDGNLLAVGAYGFNSNSGMVKVYKYENSNWSQIGSTLLGENIALNLTGTPQPSLEFGYSLDFNADGSILVVGAPKAKLDQNSVPDVINSGVVGVYSLENNDWVLKQEIFGEFEEDKSGNSVSISSDGNLIAIGAAFNDGTGNNSGHARVYKLNTTNSKWELFNSDINGDRAFDLFGFSVDISGNGEAIAIGSTSYDGALEDKIDTGLLSIYESGSAANTSWVLRGSSEGEASIDQFGYAVAIDNSGWRVAAGSIDNDQNGDKAGQVRIFDLNTGTRQFGNSINGEASGDQSGFSVSLSGDGNTIVIGAPFNDGNGGNSGHIRVFDLSNVLTVDSNLNSKFSIYPNPSSKEIHVNVLNTTLKNVKMYNNLGQLIYSNNKSTINIQNLSAGIYLLAIETDEGRSTKKVIIE